MASTIESGINTYAGHFRELIDVCITLGAPYNPQADDIKLPALETQLLNVRNSIARVDLLLATYYNVEDARRRKFAILLPTVTRVQAAAIAFKLSPHTLIRIKEIVHKIRGTRAGKINLDQTGDQPAHHVSVSQTSFNEQIDHLQMLIDVLSIQPAYTPAEADITVAALNILLGEMKTTNDATLMALTPLAEARQERNKLLFDHPTGMVDTALRVKEYVKSVFGATSPQYKQINHIKFRNKKIE